MDTLIRKTVETEETGAGEPKRIRSEGPDEKTGRNPVIDATLPTWFHTNLEWLLAVRARDDRPQTTFVNRVSAHAIEQVLRHCAETPFLIDYVTSRVKCVNHNADGQWVALWTGACSRLQLSERTAALKNVLRTIIMAPGDPYKTRDNAGLLLIEWNSLLAMDADCADIIVDAIPDSILAARNPPFECEEDAENLLPALAVRHRRFIRGLVDAGVVNNNMAHIRLLLQRFPSLKPFVHSAIVWMFSVQNRDASAQFPAAFMRFYYESEVPVPTEWKATFDFVLSIEDARNEHDMPIRIVLDTDYVAQVWRSLAFENVGSAQAFVARYALQRAGFKVLFDAVCQVRLDILTAETLQVVTHAAMQDTGLGKYDLLRLLLDRWMEAKCAVSPLRTALRAGLPVVIQVGEHKSQFDGIAHVLELAMAQAFQPTGEVKIYGYSAMQLEECLHLRNWSRPHGKPMGDNSCHAANCPCWRQVLLVADTDHLTYAQRSQRNFFRSCLRYAHALMSSEFHHWLAFRLLYALRVHGPNLRVKGAEKFDQQTLRMVDECQSFMIKQWRMFHFFRHLRTPANRGRAVDGAVYMHLLSFLPRLAVTRMHV